MNNKLLALLLAMAPVAGGAEVISEGQALDVATRFFGEGQTHASRSAALPLKLVWKGQAKMSRGTTSEAPAFYVFNRGDNQGFVIVAGDDAVRPILAYAHEGSFSVEGMPENIQGWAAQRTAEIAYLRQQKAMADDEKNNSWLKAVQEGKEIILNTPSWNQDSPYNHRTPMFWDVHAPTGCAATAVATVMGYYQWPDCGVGVIPAYTYNDVYGNPKTIDAVQLGEKYKWELMPGINGNGIIIGDEAQADAVSALMFHVGAMLESKYNYGATGVYPSDVAVPIRKHMKYKECLKNLPRSFFDTQRWNELLMKEISTEHPIYYSGFSANGQAGHAFVLDGYNSAGLYHVNWGWGGMSDGFYTLDNLAPSNQGSGGSLGANFSHDNYALIDMRPRRNGEVDPQYDSFEFIKYPRYPVGLSSTLTAPVEKGAYFYVQGGCVVNMGNYAITTKFHLAHTDKYGNVKEILYSSRDENTVMPGDYAFSVWNFTSQDNNVMVNIQQDVLPGDRIRLVYKSADGSWKPAVSNMSQDPWELILKASDHAEEPIDVSTTASSNLPGHAVATFSAEWPTYTTDATVEAYYAEKQDNSTVTLKKLESQGGELVIPANTGVVLSTPQAAKFTMVPTIQQGMAVPQSNLLKPTTANGTTVSETENAYILSKKYGEIYFHALSSSYRDIVANRSYLVVPEEMKAATIKMVFDGETTGITDDFMDENADAPLFDLTGRQVMHPVKGGIYIKNGKKFIIR